MYQSWKRLCCWMQSNFAWKLLFYLSSYELTEWHVSYFICQLFYLLFLKLLNLNTVFTKVFVCPASVDAITLDRTIGLDWNLAHFLRTRGAVHWKNQLLFILINSFANHTPILSSEFRFAYKFLYRFFLIN